MRQRFYSKPGYTPKVYGYRQTPFPDDEEAIQAYCRLRKFSSATMLIEPPSEKGLLSSLERRAEGARLLRTLQPEDHLVVAQVATISIHLEDLVARLRYFFERGVHLHLCEFWGTPLDCWSPAGRYLIEAVGLVEECGGLWRRNVLPRKPKEPEKKRTFNGKPIPWFCEVQDEVLGVNLLASAHLRRVVSRYDNERLSWSRISALMHDEWEAESGQQIARYAGKAKEAIDAYCFYKGWEERDFCNFTEVSPAQIKNEYKAKLFPQEADNGQADV